MPFTCSICCITSVGKPLDRRQIAADDLHRVGAFDTRQRLLDIILNVLREVKVDARQFVVKLLLQLRGEHVLGETGRPFVERLQRHEKLNIRERRRVAAVVGPAVLRNRGNDLRMAEQNLAHLVQPPASPASSPMVGGIDARIHRLPSSSAGRNSLPSRVTRNADGDQKNSRRPPWFCDGAATNAGSAYKPSAAPERRWSRSPRRVRAKERGQHRRNREGRRSGHQTGQAIGSRHRD